MVRYLRCVPSFLPRSVVTRILWLALIVMGATFPWLLELYRDPLPWIGPYMASAMMLMFGVQLGNAFAGMRAWHAAYLVPRLLPTHAVTALGLIVGLWLVYLTTLLLGDRNNGYAITVSLAVGVLGFTWGAGIHKRAHFAFLMMGITVLAVDRLRESFVTFLKDPVAEPVLIAAALIALAEFWRVYRAPSPLAGKPEWDNILNSNEASQVFTGFPHAFALPLERMNRSQAVTAVFEHSPLQAWVNDLAAFALVAGLIMLMLLSGWDQPAGDFIIVASVLTTVLMTLVPLLRVNLFMLAKEQLWLAGCHESRFNLGITAFLTLLKPAFRLLGLGFVLVFIISLSGTPTLQSLTWATSGLIVAVGAAAISLLTYLAAGGTPGHVGGRFVVGVLYTLEMGACVHLVTQINTLFTPAVTITVACGFALAAVLLSAATYGKRFEITG